MIGFGIKSREDFKRAGQLSDGAIIGTEFIRMLEKFESASEILMTADIKDFVARIRS
jgi:tryptophan synthase alpha subunit